MVRNRYYVGSYIHGQFLKEYNQKELTVALVEGDIVHGEGKDFLFVLYPSVSFALFLWPCCAVVISKTSLYPCFKHNQGIILTENICRSKTTNICLKAIWLSIGPRVLKHIIT